MGRLFTRATEINSLRAAWQRVRANGITSKSSETRSAIEDFDLLSERNLCRIQRQLRARTFKFSPQTGILKKKSSGGKRGIVMASVFNRVVERAWLDSLQRNSNFVKTVIKCPTSVGGVPSRSVPHGLKLIKVAFEEDKLHFVRSDISGFFDHIPRETVITRIAEDINDPLFTDVLRSATTVVLENETALGDDRRIFPTDDEGVAQGSPLSPLFGNVLLHDFDQEFNSRGITCIRFIDDFVLLAASERAVTRAFQNAKLQLKALGLSCHDPFEAYSNADKTSRGEAKSGFVFLGYDIRPGLYQPSLKARRSLAVTIDSHISFGRDSIREVRAADYSFESRQRYVQTLVLLDKVIRGWGDAFAYGNAPETLSNLDIEISDKLDAFRSWFGRQVKDQDWKTKRRLGGVCLLLDVKRKNLDEVPIVLEPGNRFLSSATTFTISTDGSIATQGRRKGKDQGRGGWAFVVHDTGYEKSGFSESATNNQMELRAVIEAIRFIETGKSVVIRTDSQYVSKSVNEKQLIKTNIALWREYEEVSRLRRVKLVWVKGHNGDIYNEKADRLAAREAQVGALHPDCL